jgi:hypothetical protein
MRNIPDAKLKDDIYTLVGSRVDTIEDQLRTYDLMKVRHERIRQYFHGVVKVGIEKS